MESVTKLLIKLSEGVQKHWQFLLYMGIGVLVRFINFTGALYFTYDQGRDLFAISRIIGGDMTLIGPTTGLQGFFTGPFWYYAGVPGLLFGAGDPYVASAWYVLLACAALPFYWFIAQRLFPKQKQQAVITAYGLALAPGNITASLQIWNPLLVLPLVAISTWLLLSARRSRFHLVLAFFLLGLGLQAEFASVAFLLAPLFLLIAWMRGRFEWRDYLFSAIAVLITLVPQMVFELRNKFLMTHSLFNALFGSANTSISWSEQLKQRPMQLFSATKDILLGDHPLSVPILFCLLVLFAYGSWYVITQMKKQRDVGRSFAWQLLLFLALIPYPLYVFWRGNNGYFWHHYLTSQFLFVLPIIILGGIELYRRYSMTRVPLFLVALGSLLLGVYYIDARTLHHYNQAGLLVIDKATARVYELSKDIEDRPVVLVYTPNVYTDQYRYVLEWQAKRGKGPMPLYERSAQTEKWFVLVEPDYQIPERLEPWYYEATKDGRLLQRERVGHLTLEKFERINELSESPDL